MGARSKSIAILFLIIGVAAVSLSYILPNVRAQQASDCTFNQKYDSSKRICREKTKAEIEEEEISKLELEAKIGKQTGTVCLTAAESWSNIGKETCVVFHPGYFYRTGYGQLFIDERQDYKNGFVVFFTQRNALDWDTFLSKYKVAGNISVYGRIERYEGHPEIKVSSLSQITSPVLINCKTKYGCIYKQGPQL